MNGPGGATPGQFSIDDTIVTHLPRIVFREIAFIREFRHYIIVYGFYLSFSCVRANSYILPKNKKYVFACT